MLKLEFLYTYPHAHTNRLEGILIFIITKWPVLNEMRNRWFEHDSYLSA